MELDEALKTAKTSIENADLPEPWQTPAFCVTLLHLLGGLSGLAANAPITAPSGGQPSAPAPVAKGAKGGLAAFAVKVGIDVATLQDIYDFSDDNVGLVVGSPKIASTKNKATREIALLIAAARQGTGLDDGWTSAAHVRDTLTHYGRMDASNFSTSFKANSDAFSYRGKGVGVEVRLTKPGWEIASELIKRLAGSPE